jgi:hypothetical protein
MYDPGGWIDDADMEGSGGSLLSVGTVDYMTLSEADGKADLPTTEEGWRRREWLKKVKVYDARAATALSEMMTPLKALDEISKPMHFRKAQCFPTKRRPQLRPLSDETDDIINSWFQTCGIHLFDGLSADESARARRLLYTWREVFESDMLKIRRTDLIEHCVELTLNARPVKSKIPLYTEKERAFCNTLLPQMEQAGLIYRCDIRKKKSRSNGGLRRSRTPRWRRGNASAQRNLRANVRVEGNLYADAANVANGWYHPRKRTHRC